MDPINILAGINLIATFGAHVSGAKKGLRSAVSVPKEKPKTYLQKVPVVISTLTLVVFIFGIFQVGTLQYTDQNFNIRFIGLSLYLTFSWIQVWAYKSLGENYSQEILVFKNHQLVRKGPYKIIRHPQYASQVLMDLGAGLLTLSYIVLPLVLIEIPLLVMRASMEEHLFEKHFKENFEEYKKNSGAFFPYVG
ncbi:MAG: isoprenylcysteine carboxylmethyltransferase family protein [Ignavibacteriaceae bacterium]